MAWHTLWQVHPMIGSHVHQLFSPFCAMANQCPRLLNSLAHQIWKDRHCWLLLPFHVHPNQSLLSHTILQPFNHQPSSLNSEAGGEAAHMEASRSAKPRIQRYRQQIQQAVQFGCTVLSTCLECFGVRAALKWYCSTVSQYSQGSNARVGLNSYVSSSPLWNYPTIFDLSLCSPASS